jgi:hypothetical protein
MLAQVDKRWLRRSTRQPGKQRTCAKPSVSFAPHQGTQAALTGKSGGVCAKIAKRDLGLTIKCEGKHMKSIGLAALVAGFAAAAISADASTPVAGRQMSFAQQSCPVAPAVANTYLRAQAGRKLTMTRSAVIAEITKQTGADGEFAGLKPCDAGYPNAVRFWIDEVIKAGTDNSTPQA